MPLKEWTQVSTVEVLRNPWWTYKKDVTLLPDGNGGVYHYVHTNGASMVIPCLENGTIALVRQYRYLNRRESIEFPCGGVKEGDTYEETARKELGEESGFTCGELIELGAFNPYNGVTDEIAKVYLALGLEQTSSHPDRTEEFESLFCTPLELEALISSGKIWDGMTLAAWMLLRSHARSPFPLK